MVVEVLWVEVDDGVEVLWVEVDDGVDALAWTRPGKSQVEERDHRSSLSRETARTSAERQ